MIRAAVVGGADGAQEELRQLGGWPDLILAVNDAITDTPTIHHAASLHPDKFPRWLDGRSENGHPGDFTTWAWAGLPQFKADRHVRGWASGSSGLFGVSICLLELGATQVVCCGIPMDHRRNRYRGKEWFDAPNHRPVWAEKRPVMLGRVRSWSGWTRDLLGEPTPRWLGMDTAPLTRWRLAG